MELRRLNGNDLRELHVIHQVISKLALAHRHLSLGGRSSGVKRTNEINTNTLSYLAEIHSEMENLNHVLEDKPGYDVHDYKHQLREAIVRADDHYHQHDLYPASVKWINQAKDLLDIEANQA